MSKDLVLSKLPKLNKKELEEIIKVATSLLSSPESQAAKELWVSAIADVLGRRLPIKALGTVGNATVSSAEEFLETLASERITRQHGKAAVRRHLVELLLADLKKRKLTPGPTMLGNNLSTLPEVFDRAYPGYREAGLLHLIFR